MGEILLGVAFLIIGLAVIFVIIASVVWIIRTVFRIDEKIELLKNIHSALQKLEPRKNSAVKERNARIAKCDYCDQTGDPLTKIDSGQLCPKCLKAFQTQSPNSSRVVSYKAQRFLNKKTS